MTDRKLEETMIRVLREDQCFQITKYIDGRPVIATEWSSRFNHDRGDQEILDAILGCEDDDDDIQS